MSDTAFNRSVIPSVLGLLAVASLLIVLPYVAKTDRGGSGQSVASASPVTSSAFDEPTPVQPPVPAGSAASGGDSTDSRVTVSPGRKAGATFGRPDEAGYHRRRSAVQQPADADIDGGRPLWWEEWADGANASAYPTYLDPLRPTSEDETNAKRYEDARLTMSPEQFALFVATCEWPLPGWLPKRAMPIVCEGREYYDGHFSIPPQNILPELPAKTRDWATVIPGKKSTYIFKNEAEYRADLVASKFAITRRRYGWATNRNFEIMSAGAVPFFCGVGRIPATGTLASLPKTTAFVAAVHLPGVKVLCDPHKKALGLPLDERQGYNDTLTRLLAQKILDYTRRYLTTEQMALYALSATSLREMPRRVLIVWASHYTIMLTGVLNGLRRLGVEVTDVPRRTEIYEGPGCDEAKAKTYAKGWFFFCRTKESAGVNRDPAVVERNIRSRYYDAVIISVTDTLTYYMTTPFDDIPYYEAIISSYPRRRILTLNDADLIRPMTHDVAQRMMHNDTVYFKRETHGCHEAWRG